MSTTAAPPSELACQLAALLRTVADALCPPPPTPTQATTARITFRPTTPPVGLHPTVRSTAMAQVIPTGTTATADVVFFDAAGNITSVDGTPEWSSSDPSVITIEAAADGLSATVTGSAPGTAQAQLTADARFGPDVVTITGLADVEVVPAEAVTATITFRPPE